MKARIFLSLAGALLFFSTASAQTFIGEASYYADKFEGRPTASGEKYRKALFTAAHRKLPFGTILRVTHIENQREVIVTVNDRGPFVRGRIIDLSRAAADHLGFVLQGTAEVKIEVIVPGTEESYFNLDKEIIKPTGWGLQLASFSQRSNAGTFAREMSKTYGMNIFLQESNVNNVPHFRVLCGPYPTKSDALSAKQKIEGNFKNAMLRQLIPGE